MESVVLDLLYPAGDGRRLVGQSARLARFKIRQGSSARTRPSGRHRDAKDMQDTAQVEPIGAGAAGNSVACGQGADTNPGHEAGSRISTLRYLKIDY
jgi:hypothetical protein